MNFIVLYNDSSLENNFDEIPVDLSFLISMLILSTLSVISSCGVVGSMVWSKSIRFEGFNLYLIFLLLHNICMCIWQIITKILVLQNGARRFQFECIGTLFVFRMYLVMNFWVNVLMAKDIYYLLTNPIPEGSKLSSRRLLRRLCTVYLLSPVVATMLTFNTKPFIDARIDPKECITISYDTQSEVIRFFLLFMFFGFPTIYVTYIFCMVYMKQLLSRITQHDFLYIFFLRLALLTVFSSAVAIICKMVGFKGICGILVVSEGIFLSLMSLQKKDIWVAVRDTYCCLYRHSNDTDDDEMANDTEATAETTKTQTHSWE